MFSRHCGYRWFGALASRHLLPALNTHLSISGCFWVNIADLWKKSIRNDEQANILFDFTCTIGTFPVVHTVMRYSVVITMWSDRLYVGHETIKSTCYVWYVNNRIALHTFLFSFKVGLAVNDIAEVQRYSQFTVLKTEVGECYILTKMCLYCHHVVMNFRLYIHLNWVSIFHTCTTFIEKLISSTCKLLVRTVHLGDFKCILYSICT